MTMTTTRTTGLPDDPGAGVPRSRRPSPLLARFPALERLPRLSLGVFPTPVTAVDDPASGARLWIKREDLSGTQYGGNKVRPLEFLLAGVRPGDEVLTVGGVGSTHALATATYASMLGARTTVVRWRQEMNPDAESSGMRCAVAARCIDTGSPVTGLALAALMRLTSHRRWIPAGGTSPLGLLGHVDAALELAAQIDSGDLPAPRRVVVPLGSGGTAAGLALGFAIAKMEVVIDAVRVAPSIVANRGRVLSLAAAGARLLERLTTERLPRPRQQDIRVIGSQYGGAYGRPTAAGQVAARWLRDAGGPPADATYSAKALAAALAEGPLEGLVFWLTFDGRTEMRS